MGPGRGTKSTGHVNYISDFWYGIEVKRIFLSCSCVTHMKQSHNRKVIMKINDLRSFTFYELRDGAKEVKDMKVAKDHVKEHALGTWRRIPTVSVLLCNFTTFQCVLLDFTEISTPGRS